MKASNVVSKACVTLAMETGKCKQLMIAVWQVQPDTQLIPGSSQKCLNYQ